MSLERFVSDEPVFLPLPKGVIDNKVGSSLILFDGKRGCTYETDQPEIIKFIRGHDRYKRKQIVKTLTAEELKTKALQEAQENSLIEIKKSVEKGFFVINEASSYQSLFQLAKDIGVSTSEKGKKVDGKKLLEEIKIKIGIK